MVVAVREVVGSFLKRINDLKTYKDLKPELKPCPFCGEAEELYWGHAHAMAFHVQCQTCGGSGGEVHVPDTLPDDWPDDITMEEMEIRLMEKGFELWNRRAK